MKVAKEEYEEEFGVEPTQEELADILGVKRSTLDSIIKSARPAISLDQTVSWGDEGGRTIGEIIPDTRESLDSLVERDELASMIRKSLSSLSKREELVVRLRFGIEEPENDHRNFPITNKELKKLNARGAK